MRQCQQKFGAVLCGAALLFGIAPADASPVAPVSLLPALDVYVDTLAAGHNAALAWAKDQAVKANLANFGFGGLGAAIDKLLPAAPSDSGSN
jgi:hypothetical protein